VTSLHPRYKGARYTFIYLKHEGRQVTYNARKSQQNKIVMQHQV